MDLKERYLKYEADCTAASPSNDRYGLHGSIPGWTTVILIFIATMKPAQMFG
jgi:hypothetical protein